MELPNNVSEQIAFNTRYKIEEHMFFVMDKSTHKKHLSQPLRTIIKQFHLAVTLLTDYNGIFKVTDKNIEFCFTTRINDDDFNVITIPKGAYELESSNDQTKRIIIKEAYFTEENYQFIIKLIFSTLDTIIEIEANFIRSQINFLPGDSMRTL